MATLKNTWTHAVRDWRGAGTLRVKNDATRVEIALELENDTGGGPLINDYYWFIADIGARSAVFSPWPGNPNRLGVWMMEGPNTTFHGRTWTISLDLADLGITLNTRGNHAVPPAVLKFALRPVSATPAFTDDSPSNPMLDFSDFNQIFLTTPPTGDMTGMIDMWRLRPDRSLSI